MEFCIPALERSMSYCVRTLKYFQRVFYRENKSRFFYTSPLLLPLFVYGPIFSRGRYVEVHLVESTNLECQSVNDKVLAPVPFS